MNKKPIILGIILSFLLSTIFPVIPSVKISSNRIIYVDDDGTADYTKIQDAIDNASDGDTVFVYNGTYYENIVIGKSIGLIGEDKNSTIINSGGIGSCLMGIAENIYISGFTFLNSSKDGLAVMFFDGLYTFMDNIISYNKRGIYCSDAKINVTNNIISNNEWGIAFENLYHCNIIGNIIQNNSDFGIGLFNCYNSVIQDNQISDNNYGIKISSSWSNIVNENNITNNTIGVGVESCDEYSTGWNKILNNYIADNDRGVYLHAFGEGRCQSSTVSMNIIFNNKYGIYLVSDTYESELSLNNISQNHIEKNEEYGIYLNNTYHNSVFSNNLVKNKINAYFEYCNNLTWNGNYWGRPRLFPYPIFGRTTFKDYEIPWLNIDWRPALKPYDITI
jgi:parallel beta-helix repeat protein